MLIRMRTIALLLLFPLAVGACTSREDTAASTNTSNMRTLPVESITVSGILVDSFCYARDRAAGTVPSPPRVDTLCSAESVKLGYPIAVVADSDVVWVLSESPAIFAKFLNDSVRVSGDIRSEGVLIPRTFDRRRDDTWENIF